MKKFLAMICFCLFAVVATAEAKVTALTPEEGLAKMKEANVFVLDVRSQAEYDAQHYATSTLIPNTEIAERLGEVPTDKVILIHCRGGVRCKAVAEDVFAVQRPDQEVYYIAGAPIYE